MGNAHLVNRGEGRASRCSFTRRNCLLAASMLPMVMSTAINAASITWQGGAGDSFTDSTKWSSGSVPGTADVAVFNNNTSGAVNFTAAANPAGMLFSNTSGAINFALGGNALTFGTAAATGTVALGSAAGQANSVTFSGGVMTHSHASGAFATIGFSGSNGNVLRFTGATTQFNAVSTGAFAAIGVANSNNNQLIVDGGAYVNWRGNITNGIIGGTAATSSTGNLVQVNSATFNLTGGSRGMNLNNGSFEMTNGYMDTGFILANAAGNNSTIAFNSGQIYSRRTQIDNGRNFVIGNGGSTPAIFGIAYSTGTMTVGSTTTPADLVLNSNGVLTGGGAGTITIAAGGKLRGFAGAKVAPSILGQPVLTTDDRSTGTISLTGAWDNTNIQMLMDVGDFPTGAAASTPFTPLDFIKITGAFTHGGKVTFDMASFVPPLSSLPVEYKVVSWTSEVGSSNDTLVEFINGGALPYRFDGTGLYLTIPEPTALSAIGLLGLLAARRRNARRNLA